MVITAIVITIQTQLVEVGEINEIACRLWSWGCHCTAKAVKEKWGNIYLEWKVCTTHMASYPFFLLRFFKLKTSICRFCYWSEYLLFILWAGVTSFNIDFAAKKVTIIGDVTPLSVLASVSKVKSAQFWPSAISSTSVSAAGSKNAEIKKWPVSWMRKFGNSATGCVRIN